MRINKIYIYTHTYIILIKVKVKEKEIINEKTNFLDL